MQLEPFLERAGCRTLKDLAQVVGIDDKHLSKVINGRTYFTESLQARLTFHLRLSSDEANIAFRFPGWSPAAIGTEQKGVPSTPGDGDAPLAPEQGRIRLVWANDSREA